jgi:hypothetical protein
MYVLHAGRTSARRQTDHTWGQGFVNVSGDGWQLDPAVILGG